MPSEWHDVERGAKLGCGVVLAGLLVAIILVALLIAITAH